MGDVSSVIGHEVGFGDGIDGFINRDLTDLRFCGVGHAVHYTTPGYEWYDGVMQRKPGQAQLTRPAPLDQVPPPPAVIENDLGMAIAADEPILWVRLAEKPGDTVREAHFVGEGTVSGDPSRSGVVSGGFTFDGTDDSVFFGCDEISNYPPALLNEAGVFSVEFLLDPAYVEVEDWTTIARWSYYGLYIECYRFAGEDASGYIKYTFHDESAATYFVDYYAVDLFTPGVQTHHACTYDGVDLKIYVDGTEVASAAQTEPAFWGISTTSSDGLGLATNGSFGGQYYAGNLAEFAIYDTALDGATVEAHATADRTPTLYTAATVPEWDTPDSLRVASSFHLWWQENEYTDAPTGDPSDTGTWERSKATLKVTTPPTVDDVYYWAMQVTFYDSEAGLVGGAHCGLQWNPGHPSSKAINWGGYDAEGNLLDGSESAFPSATDNPNTRDYNWSSDTEYTFEVFSPAEGEWRATVNGVTIRDLYVPDGVHIGDFLVWSEVFATCGEPTSVVEWSDLEMNDGSDTVSIYRVYKGFSDECCENVNSYTGDNVFVQETNSEPSEGSYLSLIGFDQTSSLWGTENYEWPAIADFQPVKLEFDLNAPHIPTSSIYPVPEWGIWAGYYNGDGSSIVSTSMFKFVYDERDAAFRTLNVYLDWDDPELGDWVPIEPVTALEPISYEDGDWYRKYAYDWEIGTPQHFEIVKTGSGEWELLIDGVSLLTWEAPGSENVVFFSFDSLHVANCGQNRLKVGLGDVVVTDDADDTEQMTAIMGYLDSTDCPTVDYYVEDDFFVVDFVSPAPRTFPVDEETVLSL